MTVLFCRPDDGHIKWWKHVAWLTSCKTTTDIQLLCMKVLCNKIYNRVILFAPIFIILSKHEVFCSLHFMIVHLIRYYIFVWNTLSFSQLSELERHHEQENVLPLLEKLDKLQAENTGLRDRNDELTVEVEALTAKLASLKTKKYIGYVECSVNSKTCFSIPIWNWGGRCLRVFLWRKKRVLMLLLLLTSIFYASHSFHLSLVTSIFKVKVVPKHPTIKMCRAAWK